MGKQGIGIELKMPQHHAWLMWPIIKSCFHIIFVREKLVLLKMQKSESRRAKIIASENGLKCHIIVHGFNKSMWQTIKSCFSIIFVCKKTSFTKWQQKEKSTNSTNRSKSIWSRIRFVCTTTTVIRVVEFSRKGYKIRFQNSINDIPNIISICINT